MRVIAIDPGFDRMGVAVMEYQNGKEVLLQSSCIVTDRALPLPERLHTIGTTLTALMTEFTPDTLAIETLFFNKNITTAIGVAQARGMVLYLGKVAGCQIYEFGPQEIKVAVTGYGKSDKTAVYDMVKRLVPSVRTDALDDEYDAVAVGITCLAQYGRSR
jgi:crossover junction endodeoxyribonuclease RuvC